MDRIECLKNAEKCICGQRDVDHGRPENTFSLIAKLWGDYLDVPLDAHDIGMMMVLFKVARARCGNYIPDNYIDIAGYAACAAEVKKENVGE